MEIALKAPNALLYCFERWILVALFHSQQLNILKDIFRK